MYNNDISTYNIRKDIENRRVYVTKKLNQNEENLKLDIEIFENFREVAWEIVLTDSTLDNWDANEINAFFDLEKKELILILEAWQK